MKIAILSDIHDNVWALAAALENIQAAEAMICCGDLCSPFIIPLLAEGFEARPIHIVFGNNDADLLVLRSLRRERGISGLCGARLQLAADCFRHEGSPSWANLLLSLDQIESNNLEVFEKKILEIAGVKEVSLHPEEAVAYLKVDKQQLNIDALQNLIVQFSP